MNERAKSSNFELYSWLFMRISGALIIFLAVTHIVIVHFVFGVDKINFKMVAERWAASGWRIFDLTLLVLALLHGSNGIRILIDDYIHAKGWRALLLNGLYVITICLIIFGGYIMMTFKA